MTNPYTYLSSITKVRERKVCELETISGKYEQLVVRTHRLKPYIPPKKIGTLQYGSD